MSELLAQNSITAMDFKTRINEIMIGNIHSTCQFSIVVYSLSYLLFANANFYLPQMFHLFFCIDLANPNSVTAKALHILPPLKFEF